MSLAGLLTRNHHSWASWWLTFPLGRGGGKATGKKLPLSEAGLSTQPVMNAILLPLQWPLSHCKGTDPWVTVLQRLQISCISDILTWQVTTVANLKVWNSNERLLWSRATTAWEAVLKVGSLGETENHCGKGKERGRVMGVHSVCSLHHCWVQTIHYGCIRSPYSFL